MNTTLYASRSDKAVWFSGRLHQGNRVGILPPVTVVENIDTIEVTNVDMTFLGHSYIGDAEALLYDMNLLITDNKRPEDRVRLSKVDNYWRIDS